jgi:Outer membrane protein beta-barrel domain
MSIRALNLVVSAVLVLGFASTGFSQPAAGTDAPTFELSAGYQFLHLPDQNFPFGLAVDGARHYGQFGLVGEIGWSRDSDDELGVDLTTNMFHFAAGPRWTRFGSGRAWPYAQVLVGAAVAHASVDVAGDDPDETETAFMIQPGVGVTFVAGDGWGMFGQVDYRRTFFDEPDDIEDSINNQFRVFVGFRMILD